jgi:hypothetical protein
MSVALALPIYHNTEDVDWVDPETGEVHRTDALRECLRTRCANDPDYINEKLPITSACFRIFLANNNTSLSPKMNCTNCCPGAPPMRFSAPSSGQRVYLGLRPA